MKVRASHMGIWPGTTVVEQHKWWSYSINAGDASPLLLLCVSFLNCWTPFRCGFSDWTWTIINQSLGRFWSCPFWQTPPIFCSTLLMGMGSSRSGFNKLIDNPVTRASQKVLKLYNSYNSYNSYITPESAHRSRWHYIGWSLWDHPSSRIRGAISSTCFFRRKAKLQRRDGKIWHVFSYCKRLVMSSHYSPRVGLY